MKKGRRSFDQRPFVNVPERRGLVVRLLALGWRFGGLLSNGCVGFLNGRSQLGGREILSLLHYE